MRLIDAEQFVTEMEINIGNVYNPDIIKGMRFAIELINSRPTAFDKEKVLSEINEEYVDAISLYNMHKGTAYAYSAEVRKDTWEKAKRIIEKGGIK